MIDNESNPYISVVLTAYNRTQFLREAFESLVAQHLDYQKFEVIIVSNYDVSFLPLSHFIKNGGNLKIIKQEGFIGSFFKSALSVASGEILCFLDDDDIFYNQKLSVVEKNFKKNRNLGYYSNDFTTINDQNLSYQNKTKIGKMSLTRKNSILINNKSDWKYVKKFIDYRGNALNSTISIRKNIMAEYLPFMEYVMRTEDEILFAISLDSDYDLMLDPLKLTKYRISNTSATRLNSTFPTALTNRCAVLQRELDTMSKVLNNHTLFKSEITVKYLNISHSFIMLYYITLCRHHHIHNKTRDLLHIFKVLTLSLKRVHLILIMWYFSSKITKNLPIKLYFAFRSD